jgi:hypothetical protein
MNAEPEAISNQSLHSKLMVLETKLETHGEQMAGHVADAVSFRADTRQALDDITERLGKGETRFALIEKGIDANTATLGEMNGKLDTLIAEENRRKGRDGVVRAILDSKALAWLIAALGAIWAVITGTGQGSGS